MDSSPHSNWFRRKSDNCRTQSSRPSFFVLPKLDEVSEIPIEPKKCMFPPIAGIGKPALNPTKKVTGSPKRHSVPADANTKFPGLINKKQQAQEPLSNTNDILYDLLDLKKKSLLELIEVHKLQKEMYMVVCKAQIIPLKEKRRRIDEALKDIDHTNARIKKKQCEIAEVDQKIRGLRKCGEQEESELQQRSLV